MNNKRVFIKRIRKTLHCNLLYQIEKNLSLITINSEIFPEDSKTDVFYFGDDLKIFLSLNKYRENIFKNMIEEIKNLVFKNKTFDAIANRCSSIINWKNSIVLLLISKIKTFKNLPYKNFTTEEIVGYPNLNICKVSFKKEKRMYNGCKIFYTEHYFENKILDRNRNKELSKNLDILNKKEKFSSEIENNYSENNSNFENNIEEQNNCSKENKSEKFINKNSFIDDEILLSKNNEQINDKKLDKNNNNNPTKKKKNIYLNSQSENKKKDILIILPLKNIKLQTKPIIKIDEKKNVFNNFELKSYRVNYDLTTNFRNIDFKFKNDRDFSLLIKNKYGFTLNEILKCNIPEKALEK